MIQMAIHSAIVGTRVKKRYLITALAAALTARECERRNSEREIRKKKLKKRNPEGESPKEKFGK